MMVFIGMNHPKHFWMFKEIIRVLDKKCMVFVSSKDVLLSLLEVSNIDYILLGNNKKGIINKIFQSIFYTIKMIRYSLKYRPSLFIGQALPHFAYSSFIFRSSRFIILEDTEHVTQLHKYVVPFCHKIYTPKRFPHKFGKKQVSVDSFYELLYLHPNYYSADPKILKKYSILKHQRYAILRIVSWNAHHDVNMTGMSIEFVNKIITTLENKNIRPYITSEKELPAPLNKYLLNATSTDIHDLLFYSQIYIGEGATMAAEAALLGVPSIYVNELDTSFCKELEIDYNLINSFRNENGVLKAIINMINDAELKVKHRVLLKKLMKEKIDLNEFLMLNVIGDLSKN
jgi:uncharacterized protein